MRRALGVAAVLVLAACAGTVDRPVAPTNQAIPVPATIAEQASGTATASTTTTMPVSSARPETAESGDELTRLEADLDGLLSELDDALANVGGALSEDEGDI